MLSCLINFRNNFVSNYNVNILYMYNNDIYIDLSESYIKYLFFFIPFSLVTYLLTPRFNIIYKMDNLYYITTNTTMKIYPIILSVKVKKNNIIDITSKFKLFNMLIPMWAFVNIIKLDIDLIDIIEFTYLLKGKMINKNINITEVYDLPLYSIFL